MYKCKTLNKHFWNIKIPIRQSSPKSWSIHPVVTELKGVLKLITLGFKFQECAAYSNKSDNLNLNRNLLRVITVKSER